MTAGDVPLIIELNSLRDSGLYAIDAGALSEAIGAHPDEFKPTHQAHYLMPREAIEAMQTRR